MVKILWNIYLAIVFCALVPRVSQLKTNRTIKLILGNLVQKKQHSEVTIWLPLSEFSFTYAQWQPHFTTKLLYFTTKQSLLCHCDLIPAAWCLRNSLASMLSTGLKRLSVVSCDDVTRLMWPLPVGYCSDFLLFLPWIFCRDGSVNKVHVIAPCRPCPFFIYF